ncbi:MAG TPA: Ig-like domain-containing protein [Longimicrobiaceae bacterium]|nr:Ig-like domain-containing protein [Longimicrobiaceae bacterium]
MNIRTLLCCSLAILGLAGCHDTTASEPLAQVEIAAPEADVVAGTSFRLDVTAKGATGQPGDVHRLQWTSSDAAVVSVGRDGRLNAIAPGRATITASADGVTATAEVAVRTRVTHLDWSVDTVRVALGTETYFYPDVRDAKGAQVNARPTFSSADSTVIRITPQGYGVGVKLGATTRLTATIDGLTVSRPARVFAYAYQIAPSAVTLLAGQSVSLQAQIDNPQPMAPTVFGTGITWTSSNPAVAMVDAAGRVTALANGSVTITASGLGHTATAVVHAVRYSPALRFVQAAASYYESCGLTDDGRVFCWGKDKYYGMLSLSPLAGTCREADLHGFWSYRCSDVPLQVLPDLRFTAITFGETTLCGLDAAGFVWCTRGGAAVKQNLPPLHALTDMDGTVCGIGADGAGYCWVESTDPTAASARVAPGIALTTLSAASTQYSATSGTYCGTTATGEAYCWGANAKGQLGTGDQTARTEPTRVATDVKFSQVSVGLGMTCALDMAGQAYCWGAWQGNGSVPAPSLVPVPAGGPSFTRIAIAGMGICALTAQGAAYCWTGGGAPKLVASAVPFTSITGGFHGFLMTGSDGAPYTFNGKAAPTGG